jgi:AcrR family transcriptional regulator
LVITVYMGARRKTYHHGDLRQALVDAALESIASVGVDAFTLRMAARAAGVSPGAPYRHFENKDALIAAVAEECAMRLGAAMDQAIGGPDEPVLVQFRRAGGAYVRFAFEHPFHFRVMSHPAVAGHQSLQGGIGGWMQETARELQAAQAAGLLTTAPVDQILTFTYATLHGLAWLVCTDPAMTRARVDRLIQETTELVGVGLLPR